MIKRIKKDCIITYRVFSLFVSSPKRLQDEANCSNITTKSLPKQKRLSENARHFCHLRLLNMKE